MPPRRRSSARDVDHAALVQGMKAKLPMCCVESLRNHGKVFEYGSMDFKKGVSHQALLLYAPVLEQLILMNPTAIFTQKSLTAVIQDVVAAIHGPISKLLAEAEAYKARVPYIYIYTIHVHDIYI